LLMLVVHLLKYPRAILGICVFGSLWSLLPHELPVDRRGRIDWIGAGFGSGGLIFFNVAWK
jgi:hypothetical protein